MQILTSFKLYVEEDVFDEVYEFIKNEIDDVTSDIDVDSNIDGNCEISVSDTSGIYTEEMIADFLGQIARMNPDSAFRCKGMIDASAGSGEYMDFEMDYDGEQIKSKTSGWYTVFYPSDYEEMDDDELREQVGEYGTFSDMTVEELKEFVEKAKKEEKDTEENGAEPTRYLEYNGRVIPEDKLPLEFEQVFDV